MPESKFSPAVNYFRYIGLKEDGIFSALLADHLKGNYLSTVIIKEFDLARDFYLSHTKAFDKAAQQIYLLILQDND
jgi:hypothetical protein